MQNLFAILILMLSTNVFAVEERDFEKVQYNINDFKTPILGFLNHESFGRILSRTTGKTFTIGVLTKQNSSVPAIVALVETKDNIPGKHVYGIEKNVHIRSAEIVQPSKNEYISLDTSSCQIEMGLPGEAYLWTPQYMILSVVRKVNRLHPSSAYEAERAKAGFKLFTDQAWFIDADQEELIPLKDSELDKLICRPPSDRGE